MKNAECGKGGVWKMRGVENAECGKDGVWKMRGVENAECGKCVENFNFPSHFVIPMLRWPTGATAAHCKTNTFLIKTLLSLCNCSCFPYKYEPVA